MKALQISLRSLEIHKRVLEEGAFVNIAQQNLQAITTWDMEKAKEKIGNPLILGVSLDDMLVILQSIPSN